MENKKTVKDLINVSKLKEIFREDYGNYARFYIKNPYPAHIFIKDIKEQQKYFLKYFSKDFVLGTKKNGNLGFGTSDSIFSRFDLKETTSMGKPYLPDHRITFWQRHLTLRLDYLHLPGMWSPDKQMKKYKKLLFKYLDKRFGEDNWFEDKYCIRIYLIKDVLKKNVSPIIRGSNFWSFYGTIWDKEVCLQYTTPPLLHIHTAARKQYNFKLEKVELKTT